MSSPNEDHREKNILLAKNLNQVKMDLRCKKKDLLELRSQLRMQKQRNSKLESDQVSILHRIDFLKQQLDDTFYKNTVGYIHLSKQLDQMHHDSVQFLNNTSESNATLPGESNATFSANNNVTQSTFLDKIKAIASNSNSSDIEHTSVGSLDSSRLSIGLQSLSFNSFSLGLSSTFVKGAKDDDDESEMNCTFLEDSTENGSTNKMANPLSELNENHLNVTLRRTKTAPKRYGKARKIAQNQQSSETENRAVATGMGEKSASDVLQLRRGSRPVKKIDYNETIRRKK